MKRISNSKNHITLNESGVAAALGGITAAGWVAIAVTIVLIGTFLFWLIYKSRKSFTNERGAAINRFKQFGKSLQFWTNPLTSNYCVVLGQDKNNTFRIIYDMGFDEIDLRNTEDDDTRNAIVNILNMVHANKDVLISISAEAIKHSTKDEIERLKQQGKNWGDVYLNQMPITNLTTKIGNEIDKFSFENYEEDEFESMRADKKNQIGIRVISK